MENKQMKCVKGESCLYCGSNYCRYIDEVNQLKSELEQMTALKDTYFACYHAKHEDLAKKYDELKAENEIFKQYKASKQASYESMQREWNNAVNENRELKQTLTEIKEIVGVGLVDGLQPEEYSGFLKILQAQILQKISEVEND